MVINLNNAIAKTSVYTDEEVQKLACDFMEFGRGVDNSDTTAELSEIEGYEWINDLVQSPATQRVTSNLQVEKNCDTGELEIVVGKQGYTTSLIDDTTECCWENKMSMFGKLWTASLYELCFKDCFTRKQWVMLEMAGRRSIDANVLKINATNYFEEREELNRRIFAFLTARNILLGQTDVSGNGLKPAAGVLDFIARNSTISIDGSDMMGTVQTVMCNVDRLGGKWLVLGNKIGIDEFRMALERYSQATNRQVSDNFTLRVVSGIDFDFEKNQTELWLINLNDTGLLLQHPVNNPEIVMDNTFGSDPTVEDCYAICNRMFNYFTVFSRGYNGFMRITGITPVNACVSELGRFAHLINADTFAPAPNFN